MRFDAARLMFIAGLALAGLALAVVPGAAARSEADSPVRRSASFAVVDRFVDGMYAVLLHGPHERERIVPIAALPADTRPGDWLRVMRPALRSRHRAQCCKEDDPHASGGEDACAYVQLHDSARATLVRVEERRQQLLTNPSR